jgi:hypothetical protein
MELIAALLELPLRYERFRCWWRMRRRVQRRAAQKKDDLWRGDQRL